MNISDQQYSWIRLDAIYYCPHHPEGKIREYRKKCNYREPGTGLFEAACKHFNIDLSASYMVGDWGSDIIARQNAGVKTILVKSGYEMDGMENSVEPDFVLGDLRDVAEML